MMNLDSLLKSGDMTLPTKIHLVKAMVFPGVTYRCEKESESRSVISDSLETPWTVACQTLLSMEFSTPEYWSD